MKSFWYSLFLCIAILVASCGSKKQLKTQSPNKQIELSIDVSPTGEISYQVDFKGKPILNTSLLGLQTESFDFTQNFKLVNSSKAIVDTSWNPIWGQRSRIQNHYHQIHASYENDLNQQMDVEFRVFDDGIAFRYSLPGNDSIILLDEKTQFNFAQDLSAWWTPQDFDSYEHLYSNSPLSSLTSVNTPLTLEYEDLFICIHEAQLENYTGMTLKRTDSLTLEAVLVPWSIEDSAKVKTQLPLKTPWRTIQIGDQLSDLVESSMILNLNDPCKIQETAWIEPMKYIGVWWEMHMGISTWEQSLQHGANTMNVKKYIDFASKNNIQGVLIEGWNQGWETWHTDKSFFEFSTPYPDFDTKAIVAYAKEKKVKIIGHHETGGNIPEYEAQMKKAFEYYKNNNINAIKTGYAGKINPEGRFHHGQFMVEHYRKVLELAAANHVMVDAHEPIKPTGLSRTYPNMMTREGARGMEWNAWSEGNSPEYTTTLPYTRLLAGPLDYTPGIFKLKFNGYEEGTRVHSTLARQLALMVILYSPLQMAADLPENYQNQPAFQFIKDFKTDYDASKFVDGKIGDYTIIARKTKQQDEWFAGAITDENARMVHIPLSFLDEQTYQLTVYSDDSLTNWDQTPTHIVISNFPVTQQDTLKIALSSAGGAALRLKAIPTPNTNSTSLLTFNMRSARLLEQFKSNYAYGNVRTIKHKGMSAIIDSFTSPEGAFTSQGVQSLIDGKLGNVLDKNQLWLGYQDNKLHLQLHFKEPQKLDSIQFSFLVEQISWIFAPEEIIIKDDLGIVTNTHLNSTEPIIGSKRHSFTIQFDHTRTTKSLDLEIMPLQHLPEWHSGSGQKAWFFTDEIIIN